MDIYFKKLKSIENHITTLRVTFFPNFSIFPPTFPIFLDELMLQLVRDNIIVNYDQSDN